MAKKASDHITCYKNQQGPLITTVTRRVFTEGELTFKDIDGTGRLSAVNDWRNPPKVRAEAYVRELTLEEKAGQLFISDWRMGKYPPAGAAAAISDPHQVVLDESGTLDEAEYHGRTIFGQQDLPGTTTLIKEWFARHLILRANATPDDMTDFLNQLHAVAEECPRFVPVCAASNSRNENGEAVFGMNDAAGVFPAWPGTLGIAAAALGSGMETVQQFADAVRATWDAAGLKKGYMYMADVMSDPRWQRTFGTFGEDPQLISRILKEIMPRIQGSEDGVTPDGVAMTIKHFPGGGARENGFDPHYKEGQWNIYATEGSLQKYHLPPFQAAVDLHPSSVMPYYAKPSADKSGVQKDKNGRPLNMEPYGFAYNKEFIQDLLRDQMGFDGYINSDTGIIHNMCWGVEALDKPERVAFALNHGGADLISGLFDHEYALEAYHRGKNGYYQSHKVPEGFEAEELVLTEEAIDRAVCRTLTEMFALGMFENPYRSPQNAKTVAEDKTLWNQAMDGHRKSVVVLKNDGVLPLTKEKLAGKKVYAEVFAKNEERARQRTDDLKELLKKMLGQKTSQEFSQEDFLTDSPEEADYALLMLYPSSGEYFSATKGLLELDICENKTVFDVDDQGIPVSETHNETTLSGASRIEEISRSIRARGGKVIGAVNFTLAWQMGRVEPLTDGLVGGFDTYPQAVLDVILGRFKPAGKLPFTLPRGDEVLAVDENGVCASPNDVPGYDKDKYVAEEMKDENKKAYAYRDKAGNYYELGFGLSY